MKRIITPLKVFTSIVPLDVSCFSHNVDSETAKLISLCLPENSSSIYLALKSINRPLLYKQLSVI